MSDHPQSPATTYDPYALYRYFDGAARLLYIGMSGELVTRSKAHIASSRWMQLAASSTIERYKTLKEVKKAEQEAVENELPLFNVQYNDTPKARERLRDYLREIGRLDLQYPPAREATDENAAATSLDSFVEQGPFRHATPRVIQLTTTAGYIKVSRGEVVTLQLSGAGLSAIVHLDADLSSQLANALDKQAQEIAWRQAFTSSVG